MSNSEADETAFVVEEVCAIIQDSIGSVIGEQIKFADNKVGPWTNNIVEGCIAKLTALHKPFKYIATCLGLATVLDLLAELISDILMLKC